MQMCLRQIVGSWVPVSGQMSRATRRAIRIFQRRQGLPVTGLLDSSCEAALKAACSATAAPEPPPEPPPPADDTSAEPPPVESAPATDSASSGSTDDEPSDSADSDSEIAWAELNAPQQEFMVTGECQIKIRRHAPIPLSDMKQLQQKAGTPGVYIVHVNGKPWYVGVAERTVFSRIQERMKVLNDFQIDSSALANRSVGWISIQSGAYPSCSISRRDQKDKGAAYRPLRGVYAVLKVLEQHCIKTLDTGGNQARENVVFGTGGSVTIHEDGKKSVRLSKDLIHSQKRR